ncbi:protein ENHANCED PSEUDOMONAS SUSCEPTIBILTY 1-like [Papaver somniferum]|uniref:protein ENHANCED PSEUDOMONAS SUSCEPTIBILTY 1-like n=1 Tax=Papaver somniferum TaxID=3469 RepID=UPI000E6F9FB2|nr:protein ENHANCED PSEUDOMONAS SUSCEPTIBILTY 1-like [Papaver somniferum]
MAIWSPSISTAATLKVQNICSSSHNRSIVFAHWEITSSFGYHTSLPCPVFERWFINKTDCPLRQHLSSVDKSLATTSTNEVPPLDGLVERCFHFTKPNIAALKERARSCLSDNWNGSRELKIKILMNSRTKLIPPSPETYFGNSIATGIVTLKEGELVKRPGFGFLASMLNEAVKSNNYEKSRSFTESWIEKHLTSSPGGCTRIIGNRFLARSSQWFNMYGNNFGWGRSSAIKIGANDKSYGRTCEHINL